MQRNLAPWDRCLRVVIALCLFAGALWAPLSVPLRALVLGLPGLYVMCSGVLGHCVAYKYLGLSTRGAAGGS
jgi:hypothetical protein